MVSSPCRFNRSLIASAFRSPILNFSAFAGPRTDAPPATFTTSLRTTAPRCRQAGHQEVDSGIREAGRLARFRAFSVRIREENVGHPRDLRLRVVAADADARTEPVGNEDFLWVFADRQLPDADGDPPGIGCGGVMPPPSATAPARPGPGRR